MGNYKSPIWRESNFTSFTFVDFIPISCGIRFRILNAGPFTQEYGIGAQCQNRDDENSSCRCFCSENRSIKSRFVQRSSLSLLLACMKHNSSVLQSKQNDDDDE